jgi:hypothetical protein
MMDVAYVLHVVFYPAFAFSLMSFGWIRALVKVPDLAEANSDEVAEPGWTWNHERESFQEGSRREFWDPTNPFSPFFVGRNTH